MTDRKKVTFRDITLYHQAPIHLWAKHNSTYNPITYGSGDTDFYRLGERYVTEIFMDNFENPTLETNVKVSTDTSISRLDFVIQTPEASHLVIVKKSRKLGQSHIDEAAFKVHTGKQDYEISRVFVLLLNHHYSRSGSLDVKHLFQIHEITSQVHNRVSNIDAALHSVLGVIYSENADDFEPCVSPDSCPCPDICHPDLPPYSIFDLRGVSSLQRRQWRQQNIFKIEDIPEKDIENPRAKIQYTLTKNKRTIFDTKQISEWFSQLTFPLHFLDYEAFGFPVPLYEAYWPFSTVVFQYSIHTLQESGEVTHTAFLHTQKSDPAKPLITGLKDSIKEKGSIVVWGKRLEADNHLHLARLHPQHALFLLDLNQRMVDLQDIFTSGAYQDYRFKGSTSLKAVLPVLVPELGFEDLRIGQGLDAANGWFRLVHSNTERDTELETQLLEYSHRDTYGLVAIYRYLKSLTV